ATNKRDYGALPAPLANRQGPETVACSCFVQPRLFVTLLTDWQPRASAFQKARAALDESGLRAVAGHINPIDFETDFEGRLAFWKALGVTDIAPGSMMADCKDSLEAWLSGCKRLDVLGAKLRGEGLRLSYHNHAFEFETFNGDPRCKLDILYEETAPENVYAELDLGWVYAGGADPAAYLRRYAARCPVIHCKDLTIVEGKERPHFVPLGEGQVDWDAAFGAAREAAVEWYIYEQDDSDIDVFECCRRSYEFLKERVLG
ncbi:MAG: sugar phosphate isomerase/epimerase, partial [Candidatus Hydrogenedentota bacterium]